VSATLAELRELPRIPPIILAKLTLLVVIHGAETVKLIDSLSPRARIVEPANRVGPKLPTALYLQLPS